MLSVSSLEIASCAERAVRYRLLPVSPSATGKILIAFRRSLWLPKAFDNPFKPSCHGLGIGMDFHIHGVGGFSLLRGCCPLRTGLTLSLFSALAKSPITAMSGTTIDWPSAERPVPLLGRVKKFMSPGRIPVMVAAELCNLHCVNGSSTAMYGASCLMLSEIFAGSVSVSFDISVPRTALMYSCWLRTRW